MIVVGLTGSIGMGKSTAARHLESLGAAVFDSDEAVRRLYDGEAAPLVEAAFPGVTFAGRIDRARLAAALGRSEDAFAKVEAIVHPLVRREQWRFLRASRAAGAQVAVLDIPLLYESGADALMDAVIVMSAPEETQRARVLARPGMTAEKFEALNARQLPDALKRARADFVVETGGPIEETRARLDAVMAELKGRFGSAFDRWRARFEAQD